MKKADQKNVSKELKNEKKLYEYCFNIMYWQRGTRKHIIKISAADYIKLIDKIYIVLLCVMYDYHIITFQGM